MKSFIVSGTLLVAAAAYAADEPPAKPEPKETMKELMLEDAKRRAAEAAAKAPSAVTPAKTDPAPVAKPASPPEKKPDDAKAAAATAAQAAKQPAAVLPQVEVKKARITVLDVQLAQQQKDIAREEKLTKPTELDKALNDSKVSKALSILGGQSADYRAGNASERVRIMEEESDLLEAIAHTKDKAEKAELQKELDELRAYRRDLEKLQR